MKRKYSDFFSTILLLSVMILLFVFVFLVFGIVSGLVLLLMSLHLGDLIIMNFPMMNHFPLNRGIFLCCKVDYFFEIGLFF